MTTSRADGSAARRVGIAALLLALGCGSSGDAPATCETFDTGFVEELGLMSAPLSPRPPEQPSSLVATSSYNRASLTPGNVAWFDNYDRGAYQGFDGRGHGILAEHEGPGALVRLWSANPHGTLRIYIDDAREPRIEQPMEAFMSEANALGAAFAYGVTMSAPGEYGANTYVPLTFERYLRVTHEPAVGGADLFWQASVKAFEPGVCVASFDPQQVDASALDQTASALGATAAPDTTVTLDWAGATATHTWAASPAEPTALRGAELTALCLSTASEVDSARAVLELSFDGVTTVRAPMRDFFAGLRDDVSARTFYTSFDASSREWCTRFRMPFRESAELRVTAAAEEPGRELRVRHSVVDQPFEDARYFHAQWTRTADVVGNPSDQRAVTVEAGGGLFVGLVMALDNRSRCWWGEGDEKVFVDDEPFPRLFGTGTEDYFGYAWASHEVFLAPFHGQPEADVGRGMDICGRGEDLGGTWWNYRFHHLDPVDFRESLRFDMEVWHWGNTLDGDAPLRAAFTGFWYGTLAQPAPALPDLTSRPGMWE